jgi:hypothetical protein
MKREINEARTGYRVVVASGPNIFALYKGSPQVMGTGATGKVQTFRTQGIEPDKLYDFGLWKSEDEAWADALAHVAKWHEDIRYTADPFDDDADHALEPALSIHVTLVEVCRDTTFTVT